MAEKTMGLPQNKCGPASIKTNSGGIAVDLDMNSPGDQLLMDISECGGTSDHTGSGIGGGTGKGKPTDERGKDPIQDDYNKDWFSNFGDGGFHDQFSWEINFGILPPGGNSSTGSNNQGGGGDTRPAWEKAVDDALEWLSFLPWPRSSKGWFRGLEQAIRFIMGEAENLDPNSGRDIYERIYGILIDLGAAALLALISEVSVPLGTFITLGQMLATIWEQTHSTERLEAGFALLSKLWREIGLSGVPPWEANFKKYMHDEYGLDLP
jgi:hypothetical protein